MAVVGWAHGPVDGPCDYFCPPHAPDARHARGTPLTEVSAFTAGMRDARCQVCGARLVPRAGDRP